MATTKTIVPTEQIEQAIRIVRGHKVMLDGDLAALYGVTTKRLNEQVRRNRTRFPADFMFQLAGEEAESLRSQIATLKPGRGTHRKYRPYAFTEQGVAMLSSVLHSPRAVRVNIAIMRAFVRLRNVLAMNAELAKRLDEIEKRLASHDNKFGDHEQLFVQVVREIKFLMSTPSPPKKRRIGFHVESDDDVTPAPASRLRSRKKP